MADKKLMIDTSILIDYFRKTDKAKSRLVGHFQNFNQLYISSITEFEIFNGATAAHKDFWNSMLTELIVLNFDRDAARAAADIIGQLKLKRITIDKPDLFIAATAVVNELTFDTLNIRHFQEIENLKLLRNQKDK